MKISLRPSTDYVKNYSKEAAAHDYFSLFNQSNHWFVALSLSLPSSFRKLPIKKTLTLDDVEWILKLSITFIPTLMTIMGCIILFAYFDLILWTLPRQEKNILRHYIHRQVKKDRFLQTAELIEFDSLYGWLRNGLRRSLDRGSRSPALRVSDTGVKNF